MTATTLVRSDSSDLRCESCDEQGKETCSAAGSAAGELLAAGIPLLLPAAGIPLLPPLLLRSVEEFLKKGVMSVRHHRSVAPDRSVVHQDGIQRTGCKVGGTGSINRIGNMLMWHERRRVVRVD